jgi:hypothetical protein
MKLSEELLDHIDGAEESGGNDSRLTRWAQMAQALERAADAVAAEPDSKPKGECGLSNRPLCAEYPACPCGQSVLHTTSNRRGKHGD